MPNLTSNPIDLRPVRERVYQIMHEMILDGVWAAGMRIDPAAVASDLKVSKTPVQEAIQKLVLEGLLVVKPRSGTFVADPDATEIQQVFEFRKALEIGAAEGILARVSPEDLGALVQIGRDMSALLTAQDTGYEKTFLSLDGQFHNRIMQISGNRLIREHYEQVNSLSIVSRARSRFEPHDFAAALADHQQIVRMLQEGNLRGFREACSTHIANALARLERVRLASGSG